MPDWEIIMMQIMPNALPPVIGRFAHGGDSDPY
jgi:ABC-type dipeptide/oligopeptide/nickel transport system permease subunit